MHPWIRYVLSLLPLGLLGCGTPSLPSEPTPPLRPAYLVSSMNRLFVFDLERATYEGTWDLEIGGFPSGSGFPLEGQSLYVTGLPFRREGRVTTWLRWLIYRLLRRTNTWQPDAVITRLDVASRTRTEIGRIKNYFPNHLALSPDEHSFYLTGLRPPRTPSSEQPFILLRFDPEAQAVDKEIPLITGDHPYRKDTESDGSFNEARLQPYTMLLSPDGRWLAMICDYDLARAQVIGKQGSARYLSAMNLGGHEQRTLLLIDLETDAVVLEVPVGLPLNELVFTADSRTLFFTTSEIGHMAMGPTRLLHLDVASQRIDTVYTTPKVHGHFVYLRLLAMPDSRSTVAYHTIEAASTSVRVFNGDGETMDAATLPFEAGLAATYDDTTLCFLENIPFQPDRFPPNTGRSGLNASTKTIAFYFVDTSSWKLMQTKEIDAPTNVFAVAPHFYIPTAPR